MTYRKKLIEVALPLEAINEASAREKSIRHGHPSTLHLWWARRPLAAARAVIFASLVDDPDDPEAHPEFVEACKKLPRGKNAAENDTPRQRLFDFIEALVQWESTTDEKILEKARELIRLATDGNPPPLLDPFAGGGSIPLEAQRLGLEAHASDLNPVAVIINKALIEIPPKFADMPPVNPRDREGTAGSGSWNGAAGLAADVRYYGEWMREKAWERIGYLYPKCNGETVIAWLWARTVKSPNPAVHRDVPLIRTYWLSKKKGRYTWISPKINQDSSYSFIVHTSTQPKNSKEIDQGTKVGRGEFICILSKAPISTDYVREQGLRGQIGNCLLAIVTQGNNKRNYYSPSDQAIPEVERTEFLDDFPITEISGYFNPPLYGYKTVGLLFTNRQKLALETFANLVLEARGQSVQDGASEYYAQALATYLTLAVGRMSNRLSAFAIWNTIGEKIEQTFAEQGVGMSWDFAEANPFSGSTGSWDGSLEWIPKCLETVPAKPFSDVIQNDAAHVSQEEGSVLISTDPPYYSSITYADFADFFYGTFRHILKNEYPILFSTISTPKSEEAVAAWHRFDGSRELAGKHFTNKLTQSVEAITVQANNYPITIYYAFKEQELEAEEGFFTAWESILSVLINGGLQIIRTWPIRTERTTGRKERKNVLASSIILSCRPRSITSPITSRREFSKVLRQELPLALREMQTGNIAPVDLAQATIGPGMAVYSRYSKVLEPDGSPLSVRTALQIINHELDAYLAEQEGEMDVDSRFAVSWFEQFGFKEGGFGQADVLARAKNTSVEGLAQAGVLQAEAGKVRLLPWSELDPAWDPETDKRFTVWETVHHLIERLSTHGEEGAARLLAKLSPEQAADARQMAYRLYSICERKNWAEQARDYNALVVSWGASQEQARGFKDQYQQRNLM